MKHLGEFSTIDDVEPFFSSCVSKLAGFFLFYQDFIYLFKVFDILLRGGKFAKPSELIFTNRGT